MSPPTECGKQLSSYTVLESFGLSLGELGLKFVIGFGLPVTLKCYYWRYEDSMNVCRV